MEWFKWFVELVYFHPMTDWIWFESKLRRVCLLEELFQWLSSITVVNWPSEWPRNPTHYYCYCDPIDATHQNFLSQEARERLFQKSYKGGKPLKQCAHVVALIKNIFWNNWPTGGISFKPTRPEPNSVLKSIVTSPVVDRVSWNEQQWAVEGALSGMS